MQATTTATQLEQHAARLATFSTVEESDGLYLRARSLWQWEDPKEQDATIQAAWADVVEAMRDLVEREGRNTAEVLAFFPEPTALGR